MLVHTTLTQALHRLMSQACGFADLARHVLELHEVRMGGQERCAREVVGELKPAVPHLKNTEALHTCGELGTPSSSVIDLKPR